ncbi:hypothetical protein Droror1_Dr00019793 [Drosera rotundifolia]
MKQSTLATRPCERQLLPHTKFQQQFRSSLTIHQTGYQAQRTPSSRIVAAQTLNLEAALQQRSKLTALLTTSNTTPVTLQKEPNNEIPTPTSSFPGSNQHQQRSWN